MSAHTENKTLIDEIINNARELPLENQDWLLAIAKGMAFTKRCLNTCGNYVQGIGNDYERTDKYEKLNHGSSV